jgi:hypothetical protein
MLDDITAIPTTQALADTGGEEYLGARRGKRAGARSARACVAAGGVPRIARRSSPLGKKGAFIACAKPAHRRSGRRGGSRMSDDLLAEALGLTGSGGCGIGAVEVMELGDDHTPEVAEALAEAEDGVTILDAEGTEVEGGDEAEVAGSDEPTGLGRARARNAKGQFLPGWGTRAFGRTWSGSMRGGHLGQGFALPGGLRVQPNRGMIALGIATGVLGGSFIRRMAPAGPVLGIGTGVIGLGLAFMARGPFLSGVGYGLLPNMIEGLMDLLMGGGPRRGGAMRGWGLGQEREPDVLGQDAGLDEAERALAQIRGLGQDERELTPLLGQDDEVAQEAREAQAEMRGAHAHAAMGEGRDPLGVNDPVNIGVNASIMG